MGVRQTTPLVVECVGRTTALRCGFFPTAAAAIKYILVNETKVVIASWCDMHQYYACGWCYPQYWLNVLFWRPVLAVVTKWWVKYLFAFVCAVESCFGFVFVSEKIPKRTNHTIKLMRMFHHDVLLFLLFIIILTKKHFMWLLITKWKFNISHAACLFSCSLPLPDSTIIF